MAEPTSRDGYLAPRPRGAAAIRDHVRDCDECGELPAIALARALDGAARPQPNPGLAARTAAVCAAELETVRRASFWPRVARSLLPALIPLPLVLAYQAWALGWLHDLLRLLFADGVATWVVGSYAAFLALLFAATYAAIPVLLDRSGRRQPMGV